MLKIFLKERNFGAFWALFLSQCQKIRKVFIFERRGERFIKLNLFPPQSSVTCHWIISISSLHLILSSWTSSNWRCASVTRSLFSFLYHLKISLQLPEPAAYLVSQFNSVTSNIPHPLAFDPGSKTLAQYKLAKQKKIVQFPNDTDVASLE